VPPMTLLTGAAATQSITKMQARGDAPTTLAESRGFGSRLSISTG
jgi:hypothetical protein